MSIGIKKEQLPGYRITSAFDGALRFLDPTDKALNKVLQENYGDMLPDLKFFAADAFGVLYGLNRNGAVSIFWTETADVEDIDVSENQFYSLIQNDPDGTINLMLYRKAVAILGMPNLQQDFAFKVEAALGGGVTIDNLYVCDRDIHLVALGKIARQIHSTPIGTKFTPT